MSIELVMPSNHLILCYPFLFLPSIFPSIRAFSNESARSMRLPKYWSFNFNISPSNEHQGLISFKMDWLDLLAVQGTLKSLSTTTVQKHQFFSAQFLQSCPTLHDPKDCSMPCFLVHHQFPELTQTHVLRVSDAIQPYHPLLFSSPAFNFSQHQGLFPMSQFFISGGQSIGVSA